MVWKKLTISLCLTLAVILAMPITASASEVYTEGNIESAYITIFRDISSKIDLVDDYVFYRSGENDYTMVVGQLEEVNGEITSLSDVIVYTVTAAGDYSVTSAASFSLTVGSSLVYSNLGNYPDLIERSDIFALSTLILVVVALCCYLLRSIFGFCLRSRYQW